MMGCKRAGYNRVVFGRCWWRGAATLLLALSFWTGLAAHARADEQVGVGPTPWLDVQLSSGSLTVKTWNRPQVQVVTDGRVDVRHINAADADPRIPKQYTTWSQTVSTDRGDVKLPEESFVLPELHGSSHDAVVARGQGNTTITIPRGTALVTAHVDSGQLGLNDYHGVFIAHSGDGGVSMNHVDGSGYVESLRGPITASDSSFNRLRVRTATGNMLFRGCTSHQIEASSNYGSIVYDNGKFQPGLARFESIHGNVALGVRGSAQIGAHSGSGHIVSSFHNNAQMQGSANTTQATVRGGGPVVTAVSKSGSVYLYNGSVRTHPRVQAELRGTQALPAEGAADVPAVPAPRYPAARQYQGAQYPARRYRTPQYPGRQYQAPQYTGRPYQGSPQYSGRPYQGMPRYATPQYPPPRYAQPQYPPPGRRSGGAPPRQGPPQQAQQAQPGERRGRKPPSTS